MRSRCAGDVRCRLWLKVAWCCGFPMRPAAPPLSAVSNPAACRTPACTGCLPAVVLATGADSVLPTRWWLLAAKPPAGMQRHRALQPASPGVVLLASRRFLSKARDQCFQAHLPTFLAGTGISKRPFTLPKRLPVSRPPFRGQSSRPASSIPCRSLVLLVRIPIPPRTPVRPGSRKIVTVIPLLDSRPALPTLPRISTPLRGLSDP